MSNEKCDGDDFFSGENYNVDERISYEKYAGDGNFSDQKYDGDYNFFDKYCSDNPRHFTNETCVSNRKCNSEVYDGKHYADDFSRNWGDYDGQVYYVKCDTQSDDNQKYDRECNDSDEYLSSENDSSD